MVLLVRFCVRLKLKTQPACVRKIPLEPTRLMRENTLKVLIDRGILDNFPRPEEKNFIAIDLIGLYPVESRQQSPVQESISLR